MERRPVYYKHDDCECGDDVHGCEDCTCADCACWLETTEYSVCEDCLEEWEKENGG